ncbi:MAG: acyl-CoA dehydrogenase family protein [Actinomycetota bacterium]
MDFAFTEEQEMLREQVRSFLATEYPGERVAELAESGDGWDEASWTKMAELGWTGLSIPEQYGGASDRLDDRDRTDGTSFLDESVLFEELGYGLYPGPYFATIALALPALQSSPDMLARVADGRARVALAALEPDGARSIEDADRINTTAEPNREEWTLTGTKDLVVDLSAVTHVVVSARSDGDIGLWLVEPSPDATRSLETVDTSRRLGRLTLDSHPAVLLVEPGKAVPVLRNIRLRSQAALALEAVGVSQKVLELARSYTSERKQFDKPIGSYQAVSHQVADMYVHTELARSLAYWAAWCVATSDTSAPRAAASATALASESAVSACERSIQVHGGIGFTWEHVLHRYYKRALGIATFDGTASSQRAAVAAELLDS